MRVFLVQSQKGDKESKTRGAFTDLEQAKIAAQAFTLRFFGPDAQFEHLEECTWRHEDKAVTVVEKHIDDAETLKSLDVRDTAIQWMYELMMSETSY